jgi:pterin-4a-carbinolamine dehydratase
VIPAKCKELIDALVDAGWNFMVNQGTDTGDHPFISIEARRGRRDVRITWHTRATGTYRLFSCMVNKRDVSLTKAMEAVTAEAEVRS